MSPTNCEPSLYLYVERGVTKSTRVIELESRELSTAPESYYRPRRHDLAAGFAVAGGVFTALYFGVTRWALLLRGVRRLEPARGLGRLQLAVVEGALLGALVAGAIGWLLGFLWERWHRRRRRSRSST